ncbi:MAG: histidine phosphatase family protein [Phycisphaerales bacterium]
MLLWLLRHGKAESGSPSGRDDDRALAPRGERQAEWLGRTIARRPDRPALILSSPILRAIETARRLNGALAAPLEQSESLEVGRPPSAALALIQSHAADPVMLVGHNPQMAGLLGLLTEGHGHESQFQTGQAFLLDLDPDNPIGRADLVATLRSDD